MTPKVAAAGKLYVVATPIGNLDDISMRCRQLLSQVDIIAAEDTRHSKKLLSHFGIQPQVLLSYHEHSTENTRTKLLRYLKDGADVALISDAGTPLIADPGYRLVNEAREAGIDIVPLPGPCAPIVALSAAGLPTDRFVFEGFLPTNANQRRRKLKSLVAEQRTLILLETPHRIMATLEDLMELFGEQRQIVLAKELTKLHETFFCGALVKVYQQLVDNSKACQGEMVLLLHGYRASPATAITDQPTQDMTSLPPEAIRIADILVTSLAPAKAASLTAKITGLSRELIYNYLQANK